MKKIFLSLLVISAAALGYWFYDTNRFDVPDKIIITPWAVEHTAQQVSVLKEKIPVSDIKKAYEITKNEAVVYFQVSKGKLISQTNGDGLRKITYFKVLEYALKNLASKGFLKDCHFLVSLNDLSTQINLPAELQHVPIFVFAKDLNSHGHFKHLLFVDSFTLKKWPSLYKELKRKKKISSWKSKKNKVFWRGKTTDILQNESTSPRVILARLGKRFPEKIDAGFIKVFSSKNETTNQIKEQFPEVSFATPAEHIDFKYQITLDGLAATYPGYLWRQASKCLNIKQESSSIQWFYDLFKENVHYIGVKKNLENLMEVLDYAMAHDEEMEKIAKRANDVIEQELTPSHVFGYIVQLLNTYSGLITQE